MCRSIFKASMGLQTKIGHVFCPTLYVPEIRRMSTLSQADRPTDRQSDTLSSCWSQKVLIVKVAQNALLTNPAQKFYQVDSKFKDMG